MRKKHYAISDLHGAYNIYEQVCAMLKPEDIVFFLGDAGDRGYENWKLIKEIYDNPQWIYLKGNHEQLAVNALKEFRDISSRDEEEAIFHSRYSDFFLWEYNGGNSTYNQFVEDGRDWSWIEKLNNLPLIMTYINTKGDIIQLSHAGFNPEATERDYLWDRNHFYYRNWSGKENEYIIHGHTPIDIMLNRAYLLQDEVKFEPKPQILKYCEGHKINIDNGVFYTGYTVLLDLDTFDVYPLYDRSGKLEVDI